ncbi:MAG: class I SAM-dependent methyltransferase [Clostridia bacterium]|nr:class I SAM-dependent methyltransferase [Clostridia bacterium]
MDYKQIESGVQKIYDSMGEKYITKTKEIWSDKNHLVSFLSLLTGNKILDIGCGVGEVLSFCFEQGFNVTGIDISKELLTIAQRNVPKAKLYHDSFYNMENINETFDGIIASYVLVHVPKEKADFIIKSIKSKLNDNGKVLLIFTKAQITNEYMTNYDVNEVEHILKKNNFHIISSKEIFSNLKTGIIIAEKI